jgi:hypothetical protein
MNSDFRSLRASEKKLLEKLLESAFPGHEELRRQVEFTEAQEIYADGTLALRVNSGPAPAKVRWRVPVEGMCPDEDGIMIHVLLHVVNGMLDELEIVKEDGSATVRGPTADLLVLVTPTT